MKKIFLSLIIILAPVISSAMSPLPPQKFPEWEWRAPIIVGTTVQSGYVSLELPPQVFSYLKPDLSDLRIGNFTDEVPYVVGVERETESFSPVPSRLFNLSSRSGEDTSFVVDVGRSGILHNRITLDTVSENFRRIVQIEGSNDQNSWRILNPRGQIFDYTVRDIKSISAKDTTVEYPDTTVRYLLVTIFDQGEAPLKISGTHITRQVSTAAHEIVYKPTIESQENGVNRSTDLVLDLGSRGIPHRRVVLSTPNSNFNRAVAIYSSDDKNNWQLLSYGNIFNIQTEKFSGSNLEFSYPESNTRYLKIAILNRDDSPITVQEATIFGVVRNIVFSYRPNGDYYLYLGNPNSRRPEYDIEKVSPYLDVATLDRVNISPVEKNPDFVAQVPPKKPLSERSPYILPTVLGVIIAILAFLLLRIVTKTKAFGSPDERK